MRKVTKKSFILLLKSIYTSVRLIHIKIWNSSVHDSSTFRRKEVINTRKT